jgi:AhpC/TSA antioxidant enzyme
LRAHAEQIRNKGASLAAIGLGDSYFAREFRQETGINFPLFIDENREAYRAAELKSANVFHLFRGDNAAARARAKAGGHSQHGIKKNPFQLGGSFVFGPGNVDRFVHISETFGDNASVQDLLNTLV